ncbi:efflux RND transporter periplasmic adaptor subunit, partial [Patescibacteria group bacterium]|nr:efflux RND transporter periplasmic adaptor subunit [Patescibacteria group bacterium]
KTNINAEISSLSAKEQALAVQKATNESAIFTAGASITTAQNTLATKKDELQITKSGYTPEQLAAQEAKVKQAEANAASQEAQIKYAEANVQNYQAQISKTTIHSPIVGIVTLVNTKLGEIVAANSNIIKIISEAKYQIEANVPEVDIADIKINDAAKVTLDAYSSDTEFGVKVILIDPAETIIDNVPTYKVTFEFSEENELIKPGMTADLDILTNKKASVISVPQRAILKKDNKKIVRILNTDGIDFKETEVKTGLRGSNGNIEILSGVNEGDKIVISIKNGN